VGIPQEFKSGLDALIAAPDGNGFNVTLESENASLLTQIAIRSDLVLLAGDAVLTNELASGQLIRLNVTELREPRAAGLPVAQAGILRLKGRTLSPAAMMLMDMVRADAEKILTVPGHTVAPRSPGGFKRSRTPARKKLSGPGRDRSRRSSRSKG